MRVGVLLGELLEDGRERAARPAPRGPELDDGGLGGGEYRLVEGGVGDSSEVVMRRG